MFGIIKFSIERRDDRDRDDCDDDRLDDPPLWDAGRLQGRQLVVPLKQSAGKHGGDQGQHAAGAVEKADRLVAIILPHDGPEAAMVAGEALEIVEVAEGIDDDI